MKLKILRKKKIRNNNNNKRRRIKNVRARMKYQKKNKKIKKIILCKNKKIIIRLIMLLNF